MSPPPNILSTFECRGEGYLAISFLSLSSSSNKKSNRGPRMATAGMNQSQLETSESQQPHHQKFAFVLLETNDPTNATTEKDRKKFIRSHARKAAGIGKKAAAATRTNARNDEASDRQPPPLSEGKSRFRLNRPTPTQKRLLKAPVRGINQKKASSQEEDSSILPGRATGLVGTESYPKEDLQIFRDSGLVDPFDSLPIKLGPKQKTLLYFCKYKLFASKSRM